MPTEEYFRAKSTGIADMSKPGAAEGLIARRREQDQRDEAWRRNQASIGQSAAAGRQLGEGLADLLRFTFPVWSLLLVWGAGCATLAELAVMAGLSASVESLPVWYLAAGGVAVAVPVVYFRRPIRNLVQFALFAIVVLVIGAFLFGVASGIWEQMST